MESRRNQEHKLELGINDILFLANETKSTLVEHAEESFGKPLNTDSQGKMVKEQLEQSMNDIFTALIDNIKLRDADKVDVVAALNSVPAIDQQLQEKVKQKQIELNEQINKTVTCRVRRPEDWAGMMKQACQAESKTTEQFSVILPEVKEEEDQDNDDLSIQTTIKEYRDAVKLLADLNKNIPSIESKIERLQTVIETFERDN